MKKLCILLAILMVFTLSLPVFAEGAEDQNRFITRAEFLKEVLESANIEIENYSKSSFEDVTGEKYISYIETAYKNGLVSGYGNYFKPEAFITKEQAIIIIVKVFGEKAGLRLVSPDETYNASVSPWAKSYITYALKNNMIGQEDSIFDPKGYLTISDAQKLIKQSKQVHEKYFTRDGLSAADLLLLANKENSAYTSYKQQGSLEMNMKMLVEGISLEQVENHQEIKALLGEGIQMNMEMVVQAQSPDKAYIKQIIQPAAGQPGMTQEIEILMDGSIMYTKMMPSDKWIMQDMSSIMNQLQSLSNNDPYKMSQLSDLDLELFKEYARFERDEKIDHTGYYVVKIDIDKEAYRKYYMEIMDKTMNSIIEMQIENPQYKEDPSFNPELFRQMMNQMISQMEMEIAYKFYINKDTKNYEKMWISQEVYIPMDHILAQLGENLIDENMQDVSIKMFTRTEGLFNFYDFNGEVAFPVISPENIAK